MIAPQVASNGVVVRAPATGGVAVRNTQGYNSVELIINLATVDKETPGNTLAAGLYRIVGGVDTFGALGCGCGRARQEGRPDSARSHGRWLHLGLGIVALVSGLLKCPAGLQLSSCHCIDQRC